MFPCRGQFVHFTESPTDQVQKHSETALDTQKKEGTESSFLMKMHLIPGKTPAIYKIFCGANVVQNPKEKSQIIENQGLAICCVPCGLSVFEPVYGRFG